MVTGARTSDAHFLLEMMVEVEMMAIVQNVKALLMSQRRHVKVRESCIMQIIISVFCWVFIVG